MTIMVISKWWHSALHAFFFTSLLRAFLLLPDCCLCIESSSPPPCACVAALHKCSSSSATTEENCDVKRVCLHFWKFQTKQNLSLFSRLLFLDSETRTRMQSRQSGVRVRARGSCGHGRRCRVEGKRGEKDFLSRHLHLLGVFVALA